MKFVVGLIAGVVLTLVVGAAGAYLAVVSGWIPAAADSPELPFEAWAAKHDLHAVLQRDAQMKSPIEPTEDNLATGARIYQSSCAGCHGTPKNPVPDFAKGFDPPPTLFGNGDLVTDDPEGFTYWKVRHGMKFTGMPSFRHSLGDEDMWKVALFLKHMDKLPPKAQELWKSMQ